MLKKTLTFIQNKTSCAAIAVLLLMTLTLMFLMNGTDLPFSSPTIVEHSGGLPILDLRPTFSPDDAYKLFTALGSDGRRAYLLLHLGPDMFFPMGYALVFAFISSWFLIRLWRIDHPVQWLCLMPLISGLADILENLSLSLANLFFPERIDWLVRLAYLLNRLKFGLLPIGSVFLIVIVALWFRRNRPESNISGNVRGVKK